MPVSDNELIRIIDTAMAEAARRAGSWLVCRPGCYQCCYGPFAITVLDAVRLQEGMSAIPPEAAARVEARAIEAVRQMDGRSVEEVLEAADLDDTLCPALEPGTGTCELYEWRPVTCRLFGPPVRCGPSTFGVCELCFEGATDEQIAACEVEADPNGLEAGLDEQAKAGTGWSSPQLVATALVAGRRSGQVR